jgi:hypothetical protein
VCAIYVCRCVVDQVRAGDNTFAAGYDMSDKPRVHRRIEIVLERLASIDPRFVFDRSEPRALFVDEIEKGVASLDALWPSVVNSKEDHSRRLAALTAIGAIVEANVDLIDPGWFLKLGQWIQNEGNHPDFQAEATRVLLRGQVEAVLLGVEARLGSDDPAVQGAAAHAMGVAKNIKAVEKLKALLAHGAPGVQSSAAWALGEIGDPGSIELLEAAFRAQKVLVPVIEALGKLGGSEQASLLTIALREDSIPVRLTAAEALAKIIGRVDNAPQVLQSLASYLEEALASESDPKIAIVLIALLTRLDVNVPVDNIQRALGLDFATDSVRDKLLELFRSR